MPTDFEFQVLNDLGEIKALCAANSQDTTNLREELYGENGHITRIDREHKRQWFTTAVIAPLTVSLQALLKHFGVTLY